MTKSETTKMWLPTDKPSGGSKGSGDESPLSTTPPSGDPARDAPDVMSYNVGASDYAKRAIQPWDIWVAYNLDPFRADILKRTIRTKEGEDPRLDLRKIKHICDKLISLYDSGDYPVKPLKKV